MLRLFLLQVSCLCIDAVGARKYAHLPKVLMTSFRLGRWDTEHFQRDELTVDVEMMCSMDRIRVKREFIPSLNLP